MKVEMSKIAEWGSGDPRTVLATLCEDMIGSIAASPEFQVSDDYPAVRLVLSDQQTAEKWGVDDKAVGYFAVMSPRQFEDDDDEDGWYDVNEYLEVHLNMDVIVQLLREAPSNDLECELEAWLVTIPHELAHVVDWVRATGGKTPIEVFDLGEGELEIKRVLDGIGKTYQEAGRDAESEIESKARQIIGRLTNSGNALIDYADELAPLLILREVKRSY